MLKNHNSIFSNCWVIALCKFSLWNFVRSICPKVQRLGTSNSIHLQNSLRRSALHKNQKPVFSNFWVIALCKFLLWIFVRTFPFRFTGFFWLITVWWIYPVLGQVLVFGRRDFHSRLHLSTHSSLLKMPLSSIIKTPFK